MMDIITYIAIGFLIIDVACQPFGIGKVRTKASTSNSILIEIVLILTLVGQVIE